MSRNTLLNTKAKVLFFFRIRYKEISTYGNTLSKTLRDKYSSIDKMIISLVVIIVFQTCFVILNFLLVRNNLL